MPAMSTGGGGGPTRLPANASSVGKAVASAAKPTAPARSVGRAITAAAKPPPMVSGSNRRGGAVGTPTPSPRATAAKPMGTTRHQYGLGPSATISNPAQLAGIIHALRAPSDIMLNIGKDLVNLPASTLQGTEQLGGALAHDIGHSWSDVLSGHPLAHEDATANMVEKAWRGSVLGHLARGDLHGALATFKAHPVYGASEFAGGYGLLGRAGGAVARSGALGERVAAAGSTAREGRELAPGFAPDVQHYSKNLATKQIQQAIENHPQLQQKLYNVTGRSVKRGLQKRVDEFVPVVKAREQAAVQDTAKALKKDKPEGTAAHVVPHAVMGTAGAPEHFVTGLEQRLADLKAAEQAHHAGEEGATLSPAVLRANQQAQENIAGFLAHPDVKEAFTSAAKYAERQREIEAQKAQLGLGIPAQMERRALEPYAQANIPGAKIIPKNSIPTIRALEARQALKDVGTSKKELVDAEKAHIKLTSSHGDAERAVRDAERKLAAANKQEFGQQKFIQGRFGLNDELRTARARTSAATLDRRLVNTDTAQSHLQDLKGALAQARQERKATGQERIAAAKENLKAAREEFQQVHKSYVKDKFGGLVIHDSNAPVIRTGRFKGQQLRQLTNDEIKAHMDAQGVPQPAYVRLTAPSGGTGRGFLGGALRRGGSRTKAYTGRGLLSGAHTPGYEALSKSQIADVKQIERARAHDDFIHHEFGLRDENGNLRTFGEHEWQKFADEYHKQTGVELAPVYQHPQALSAEQAATIKKLQNEGRTDEAAQLASNEALNARIPGDEIGKGRVVLGPKEMLNRYEQHLGLRPTKILPGVTSTVGNQNALTTLNRAFRNTVLPFSTKWLMGNVTEAALRSALVGAGPRDYALAGRVIGRMRELEQPKEPHTLQFEPGHNAFKGADGTWHQEWGRGLIDNQGVAHTWRESGMTHNDKLQQLDEQDRGQHLSFFISPEGRITRMQTWPSSMNETQARNAVEAAISRTRDAQSRPSIAAGSADRLERLATGGLHYGMQHRINMEQIGAQAEPRNAGMAVARKISTGYQRTIQGIYSLNRHMESSFEKGVLGQHIRNQVQEFAKSWANAATHQKQYIDQLAKGYADPRMAADAGRYVHNVLGQYDRFSPGLKQFVSTVAPFYPWYRNALKFIYYTLPAGHPITQALLLDTNRVNQKAWTKAHDVPHDPFFGMPTGDLESALKTGPHDFLNLGRYTPAGAFTQGPLDYAANSVLPQFQGILHSVYGQDPFGNAFQGPGGKDTDKAHWALYALNQLLSELAGPTNVAQRVIAQHGSTPYNTTTLWNTQLKPDTHHGPPGVLGGLNRVFNPLEPTHLAKNRAGTKGYVPTAAGSVGAVGGRIPKAVGTP